MLSMLDVVAYDSPTYIRRQIAAHAGSSLLLVEEPVELSQVLLVPVRPLPISLN